MANEWQTKTVRQLVGEGILERPMDGNHGEIHPKASDFVSDGIPFIMASNLVNGYIDIINCAFITEKHARTLRKGFAKAGDVLISHKATMGRTAIIEELSTPFIMLTPQVTYYRVKDSFRLSNKYLKFYFDNPSFQQLFETWGQKGSTRAYLGITSQLDLPIVLPPIEEQRAIAHILGTLDDKIELNRRMNETLEAMARALFKAWFVDFEPVRAKLEGRWQRGQSLPGLPAHLYDLFPDRLVDSELGEIPEGWERVPASQLIDFNPTESLQKGVEAPYIEMASLPTSGCWPEIPVPRPFGSGMRFRNGDTLLARITPCLENGKTAFIQCLPENSVGWGSTEYIVMRTKAPVPPEFSYLLARDDAFREQAIRSMTGTSGRQRVQADSVAAFKLVAPPNRDVWGAFSRIVTLQFRSIKANAEAVETLSQLRDALLPKLISGELRIGTAETMVGQGG